MTRPATSVFDMGKLAKRKPFDFSTVKIRPPSPIPPLVSQGLALVMRMKPGESVVVPHAQAKTLAACANKAKLKVVTRRLDEHTSGVWKL